MADDLHVSALVPWTYSAHDQRSTDTTEPDLCAKPSANLRSREWGKSLRLPTDPTPIHGTWQSLTHSVGAQQPLVALTSIPSDLFRLNSLNVCTEGRGQEMLPSAGGCGKHLRVAERAGTMHERAKQRKLLTFRKSLLRDIAVLPSAAAETSRVSRLVSSGTQLS